MGFVAIFGIIALSGMIIRNSVILIDEIDMDIARGLHPWDQQLSESQEGRIRPRLDLKPGTRLVREWQGRTYEVLVLDDGFSWQGTGYRSLPALARKITGTAWSGPLFFGLKPNRTAALKPSRGPGSAGVDGDAAS